MSIMVVIGVVFFVVLAVALALASTYLSPITYTVLGAVVGLAVRAAVLTVRHRHRLRHPAAAGHLLTIGLGCAAVVVVAALVNSAERGGLTLGSYAHLFAARDATGDGAGYVTRSIDTWASVDATFRPHLMLQLLGLAVTVVLIVLVWVHHIRFAHQLRGTSGTARGVAGSAVVLVVTAGLAITISSGAVFDVYSTHSSVVVPGTIAVDSTSR